MTIDMTNDDAMMKALQTFDVLDPETSQCKRELFEYARTNCPVVHTEGNGGWWLITRYADVRRVLLDPETFSSTEVGIISPGVPLTPIDIDPPLHTDVRRIINPFFSRSTIKKYEPELIRIANSLIDKFIDKGSFEANKDFADPFVSESIVAMIFEELDGDELAVAQEAADEIKERPSPAAFEQMFKVCQRYFTKVRTDDEGLMAAIVNGEVEGGRKLTDDEKVGVLTILIMGGLDTTRSAIANILYRMTEYPGLEDRVRDPGWVRKDMDELLRLDSALGQNGRVATKDAEVGGVEIKEGERLHVRFDSANRDRAQYGDDADKLDFEATRAGHAVFGMGPHRCVGSNVARLELEVAFRELLGRIRNIRPAPGFEKTWAPGLINSLVSVPLEFDRVED